MLDKGGVGEMEAGRTDWRSRGVVMEMGVVEGMARECMGDMRAEGAGGSSQLANMHSAVSLCCERWSALYNQN